MKLNFEGIPTEHARRLRLGEADANGQRALERIAEGSANPCRHCLGLVAEGSPLLVLSYRPFESVQPYAETGPVFLHAEACARYSSDRPPEWFAFLEPALVRGYGVDDWIRYDAARIVRGAEIAATCEAILADPAVAYVHVRSKFNCFQCRVDRG